MKKKLLIWSAAALVLLAACLAVYPTITFDTGEAIVALRYSDDFSEFETNPAYGENYFYNEKWDVSICSFEVDNFLFFHVITMEYAEGDAGETEYLLEESYIEHFLSSAIIEDNPDSIDLSALIQGKEAILGNTRYPNSENYQCISYILDGRHELLFVYYVDDLLVLRVGWMDEGPKFIAYR